MNALLLNGAAGEDPLAETVRDIILEELKGSGIKYRELMLYDQKIAYCRGCFKCWVTTPGICMIGDFGREIAAMIIGHNLIVLLTPVTFGGYSSHLKRALDRLIPNISPFFVIIEGEIHHVKRYERYPDMLAVGLQPEHDPEAEEIFPAFHINGPFFQRCKIVAARLRPSMISGSSRSNHTNARLS